MPTLSLKTTVPAILSESPDPVPLRRFVELHPNGFEPTATTAYRLPEDHYLLLSRVDAGPAKAFIGDGCTFIKMHALVAPAEDDIFYAAPLPQDRAFTLRWETDGARKATFGTGLVTLLGQAEDALQVSSLRKMDEMNLPWFLNGAKFLIHRSRYLDELSAAVAKQVRTTWFDNGHAVRFMMSGRLGPMLPRLALLGKANREIDFSRDPSTCAATAHLALTRDEIAAASRVVLAFASQETPAFPPYIDLNDIASALKRGETSGVAEWKNQGR